MSCMVVIIILIYNSYYTTGRIICQQLNFVTAIQLPHTYEPKNNIDYVALSIRGDCFCRKVTPTSMNMHLIH